MVWTAANVIALVVALGGAAVSLGVFLQKVQSLTTEVTKLHASLQEMRESRYRQGKRLGRIEGWIAASEGAAEGKPPALRSSRHSTQGIPLPARQQDSGANTDDDDEGAPRG